MRSIIIQAMNIHTGGGAALLRALLSYLTDFENVKILVDERIALDATSFSSILIKKIKPNLFGRFSAEMWLRDIAKDGDIILCFGNLPPLRPLKGHVIVFVQNRLLIENVKLNSFSFKTRLRILLERKWLSFFSCHANSFIVQTPSMQSLLAKVTGLDKKSISVLPFIENPIRTNKRTSIGNKKFSLLGINSSKYIYPASGDAHKNHMVLLQAWVILAEKGFFPTLYITVDAKIFHNLHLEIIKKISDFNLKIVNFGFLSHNDLLAKYRDVDTLIFPSLVESFGIPLLEAREAGLAILASELDYVRDILDPDESFNPMSPNSIASAVLRHHSINDNELKLLNPKEFLDEILFKN